MVKGKVRAFRLSLLLLLRFEFGQRKRGGGGMVLIGRVVEFSLEGTVWVVCEGLIGWFERMALVWFCGKDAVEKSRVCAAWYSRDWVW